MRILRILVLLFAAGVLVAGQEPMRRVVYVMALDNKGAPITDLTAADFEVKEGGKAREIIRVEPALGKLQIAILVDDNGTGFFRVAVARFIESLLGRAEFSISTVEGQMLKLVDYTTETRDLSEAVQRLSARPATNGGGQLLDGIVETSQDMAKRKAGRPIIVALTVGGPDVTPIQPDYALNELRKSGAALHVVSVLSSAMAQSATQGKASDMIGEGHALSAMLGDGPRRSGGHREEISAMAGVTTGLHVLADQLKQQYLLEYSLAGANPSDRVSISVKRKGVTLRAPTYVPDKF